MSDINMILENKRDEMVKNLISLIKINSVRDLSTKSENAPFGIGARKALDRALEIANKLGFETTDYDGYIGACDIGKGEIKVAVLCHLDVVPEGDGWTVDPYEGIIADGKIIGRGAIDDKGPAISAMYALWAVKEMSQSLDCKVRLLLGCDEECGSSDIEYYLTKDKMPKMVFTPDGSFPVINIEKGRATAEFEIKMPQGVKVWGGAVINAVPSGAQAEIPAEFEDDFKEIVKNYEGISYVNEGDKLIVTATGKSAHASTPWEGTNAITMLIKALGELFDGSDFSSLAKVFPFGEYNGKGAKINFNDDVSGETTCVFSIIEGNVGKVDIRFPVCTDGKTVTDNITSALEEFGIKMVNTTSVEPHYVDSDSDFVKTLLEVFEEQTGKEGKCVAIGGGTYVHEIEGGVAFGAEIEGVDYHMHGADEFITIDELVKDAQIYAHAILRLLEI